MSSTANPRQGYDAEFEARVATARRRKRALRAANIDDHVARADFEAACLARLGQPASVTFEWRNSGDPRDLHCNWVMLCFDTRPNCNQALEELQGFKHAGKKIKVRAASKVAIPPFNSRGPRPDPAIQALQPQAPLPPAPHAQAPQSLSQAQVQTQRIGQALGVAPGALTGIVSAVAPTPTSVAARAPVTFKSDPEEES